MYRYRVVMKDGKKFEFNCFDKRLNERLKYRTEGLIWVLDELINLSEVSYIERIYPKKEEAE